MCRRYSPPWSSVAGASAPAVPPRSAACSRPFPSLERASTLSGLRQAAISRLRAWAGRRHGVDNLAMTVYWRRVYLLPTRCGIMLASLLFAMLIGGLNYNSNLGLAFAFLMVSLALVAMHHCHRNLLGLHVDVTTEADAFAGREASFEFVLQNDSNVDRCDVEIHCRTAAGIRSVAARSSESVPVAVPVPRRGVTRFDQFELSTRYPFGW